MVEGREQGGKAGQGIDGGGRRKGKGGGRGDRGKMLPLVK